MAGRIPENILEDILSRTDIVELVSGYIPLKKAGRNFRANCPFHKEKTPSFMVSSDKQIYHCFGCGAGGNAFNFLIQYERLEFPEAVEFLAKKAGITLPESQKQDDKTAGLTTQLYKANESAMLFYQRGFSLPQGKRATDYLLKRGLKEETFRLFKLGFAADSWDGLMNHLRAEKTGLAILEKAGLVIPKKDGGFYDRFRNRIIFPIQDIKSRCIGFGGRVLDETLPKYLNSPETFIYTKGNNLYGLNLAKDAIREEDYAVIVEGYLDLIMPYQEGLKNIVASLGTALTPEQARLLKRYTRNVVMVYDPDTAGQNAALRSLDIFIEEDMQVRVASLSQGMDPDLFVRKNGIASFRERIKRADNLFDYKLKVLKSRNPRIDIEAKAGIAAQMLVTIRKFSSAVLRSEYIKNLAEALNLKEGALIEELNKIKDPAKGLRDAPVAGCLPPSEISAPEKLLIKLMLEDANILAWVKAELRPSDFQGRLAADIVSAIFDSAHSGRTIEPHKLLSRFEDKSFLQAVCASVLSPQEEDGADKEKIAQDCVRRIRAQQLAVKRQRLHQEIKSAQDSGNKEKLDTLIKEFECLIRN